MIVENVQHTNPMDIYTLNIFGQLGLLGHLLYNWLLAHRRHGRRHGRVDEDLRCIPCIGQKVVELRLVHENGKVSTTWLAGCCCKTLRQQRAQAIGWILLNVEIDHSHR
eukprot:COSAG02_NODE_16971_length_1039_cov_1.327660_3_plen_109_part_00